MYIVRNKSRSLHGKKIYHSVLLRESYRKEGKVNNRTIANLSHCTPQEIQAIELALRHKNDLSQLGSLQESLELEEGLSVGAVWSVYQITKRAGIAKALGAGFEGKLALWQVIARVIDQGSRLSAVRLAQTHAACDVLQIERGFDENDLYENLRWLADHQAKIEEMLFAGRRKEVRPEMFLYDVTSSYLEGEKNFFGQYGYNRDGKKGKKQIVVGLLCDEQGDPVSTEVFAGNTQDTQTFVSQVSKTAERFGCQRVTFVGDRGMIKMPQIEALPEGFHYITAITKAQIQSLCTQGVIQIGLFDAKVCEIEDEGVRYILRRNPRRVEEISASRREKIESVEKLVQGRNTYLSAHGRAKVETAVRAVSRKIARLKMDKWLSVSSEQRSVCLRMDTDALREACHLDGCYVIKTDLPAHAVSKECIHERYKDLAEVERAFRTCKTDLLEMRPVFVRGEKSTRGHVLVVMLAYMVARVLRTAWSGCEVTVEEGLKQLSTLCMMKAEVKDQFCIQKIPRPREQSRELLKALGVTMPSALPHREVPVVTRKKLTERRKAPKSQSVKRDRNTSS